MSVIRFYCCKFTNQPTLYFTFLKPTSTNGGKNAVNFIATEVSPSLLAASSMHLNFVCDEIVCMQILYRTNYV